MADQQQRRGWTRLAFAAVALALLVTLAPPQESGLHRTSAGMTLPAASSSTSFVANWARWEWPAVTHATSADHAAFTAILPVLFVGLLAPLELSRTQLVHCDSRTPSAPALPSTFQRPPPQLL